MKYHILYRKSVKGALDVLVYQMGVLEILKEAVVEWKRNTIYKKGRSVDVKAL